MFESSCLRKEHEVSKINQHTASQCALPLLAKSGDAADFDMYYGSNCENDEHSLPTENSVSVIRTAALQLKHIDQDDEESVHL